MSGTIACAESPPLELHTLRARLTARLGLGVGVACTDVNGDPQALFAEELAAIGKAVPRRQREFAAGRQAARQAMAQIGRPAAAIVSAPDRSPVWPDGLTGSISHTGQLCVAVVGPTDTLCSIGIDVETDQAMEASLWKTVCTPEESTFVAMQPMALQGRLVTWLFSAKEAFYKWQYPQTRRMLDFQDVQLSFDRPDAPSRFRVTCPTVVPAWGRIEGHCMASQGHLISWVIGSAPHATPHAPPP